MAMRLVALAPLAARAASRAYSASATARRMCAAAPYTLLRDVRPITRTPQYTQQTRRHSAPASRSQVYDFERVKELSENPSKDRVLVDVREPSEFGEGYIPTSINLPIKSAPEALLLPADEFEDRFGFAKPTVDQEVVFYCKAGVRSSAAAGLAQQAGYRKVGEYRGSWLDWAARGGKIQH